MSITADPLFVAAEAQWRRERLTIAFQTPGTLDDDVLAPRHQQHEHQLHRVRRLIVSRLPHRHGHAATEPELALGLEPGLAPGSQPDSEVATRAA